MADFISYALVDASKFSGLDYLFVRIRFTDRSLMRRLFENKPMLIHHLQRISNHILNKDIVRIESKSKNNLSVLVRCATEEDADDFLAALKRMEQSQWMKASIVAEDDNKCFEILYDKCLEEVKAFCDKMTTDFIKSVGNFEGKLVELEKLSRSLETLGDVQQIVLQHASYNYMKDYFENRKEYFAKFKATTLNQLTKLKDGVDESNLSVEDLKNFMKTFSIEKQRYLRGCAVHANKDDIIKTVAANQVSIIFGNSGMGKTSQIVQYIYGEYKSDKIIVCTQPWKAAAINVARRVAHEMGSRVGHLVGYWVRADRRLSNKTRILFITDHELLNEWFRDELFSRYFCIILDEVQERTIYTDLLFWSLKQNLSRRPDLKVIIISTDTKEVKHDLVEYFKNFNPNQLKLKDSSFPVLPSYETDAVSKNYVNHACQKVLEFHRKRKIDDTGDILVFLTSPSEIEEAIEDIKSKNISDLLPMALHERMRADDLRDALAPTVDGFRKVVFATNVAQASLTVPGIFCVIDTGRERLRNSGIGNRNSYRFQKISSYSAEERKKLAGRTNIGICYRLYSEDDFKSMQSYDTAEVSTYRLDGLILKLISHGINKFECLELFKEPTQESITKSLNSLQEVGAIDHEKELTELGKLLAEINLNPKHGEFILMGIKNNLGYESLVISVLGSFEKCQLMKLDKNKRCNMDLSTSMFHDECGDMISWLNIYQEFIRGPTSEKESWCNYFQVNLKTLLLAEEKIDELYYVLTHDLNVLFSKTFDSRPDVNWIISKIIFELFWENLARFTGVNALGYISIKKPNVAINLHPFSFLRFNERFPLWIVFDSTVKTLSESYISNASAAPEAWVDKFIKFELLSEDRINQVLITHKRLNILIGSYLRKELMETSTTSNLRQKSLYHEFPTSFVQLDFQAAKPFLYIYASSHSFNQIKDSVYNRINSIKTNMYNETMEKTIERDLNGRAIIGRGGMVDVILLAEDEKAQLAVSASKDSNAACLMDIELVLKLQRGVKKVYWVNDTNYYLLTFNEPSLCENFKNSNLKSLHPQIADCSNLIDKKFENGDRSISIVVTKVRRKLKHYGFIHLKPEYNCSDFVSNHPPLIVTKDDGLEFEIEPVVSNSCNQLYVKLEKWITGEHIEKAFKRAGCESCYLKTERKRQEAPESFDDSANIVQMRDLLHNLCPAADRKDIDVLTCYDEKVNYYKATIQCQNSTIAKKVFYAINSEAGRSEDLKADYKMRHIYYTPVKYFNQSKIDAELRNISSKIAIKSRSVRNSMETILICETEKSLLEARRRFDPLLQGDKFEENTYNILYSNTYKSLKEKLEKNNDVQITFHARSKSLVFFGRVDNVRKAKEDMKEQLKEQTKYIERVFDLRDKEFARGLMKHLIRQYGCDLLKLKREVGAAELIINLRQHQLGLIGPQESSNNLESLMVKASNVIEKDKPVEKKPGDFSVKCPVCLDTVSTSDYYLTEFCQHAYCSECFASLIKIQCQESNFPIRCIGNGCSLEIVWQDIYNSIGDDDDSLQHLVESSVKHHISINPETYGHCLVADCPGIHRKTKEKEEVRLDDEQLCEVCWRPLCTSCGLKSHPGMNCETNRICPKDLGLRRWIKEDLKRRGICPNPACLSGIEIFEGYYNMTCAKCETHICWICRKAFRVAGECHQHLKDAHKIFYD